MIDNAPDLKGYRRSDAPFLALYKVDTEGNLLRQEQPDPLRIIRRALNKGEVVAIKGMGGFHLAGDGSRNETVSKIREIKGREEKPLALMGKSLDQVRRFCLVTEAEETALTSSAKPIVLLERRVNGAAHLSPLIAPGQARLGMMLPYTALHHLIMEQMKYPLVMTSCNRESLPMITDEAEFTPECLKGVSWVLSHGRTILSRCDDSVLIGSPQRIMIRRARGLAKGPLPVPKLPFAALGVGGDLKNTLSFLCEGEAVVTPHLGSLENEESSIEWKKALAYFYSLLGFCPEVIGCDLHPAYETRRFAYELGAPVLEVQHHYAHIASCMAENMLSGPVLGIAFDGAGYGPDGTIWGGEFLQADYAGYRRVGSLNPLPLPGGDLAVKAPWRMALSYLYSTYRGDLPDFSGRSEWDGQETEAILRLLEAGFYPLTSSAGRLFDAVASLLGVAQRVTYEGQAAMALESLALASSKTAQSYDFDLVEAGESLCLDFTTCLRGILGDLERRRSKKEIAWAFHLTLAKGIEAMALRIRYLTELNRAVLSGGVFQNTVLLGETVKLLQGNGF